MNLANYSSPYRTPFLYFYLSRYAFIQFQKSNNLPLFKSIRGVRINSLFFTVCLILADNWESTSNKYRTFTHGEIILILVKVSDRTWLTKLSQILIANFFQVRWWEDSIDSIEKKFWPLFWGPILPVGMCCQIWSSRP